MEDDFAYKKRFLSLNTIGFGAAQPPMVWGWPNHPHGQRGVASPPPKGQSHTQFLFIYVFIFYNFLCTVNLLSVAIDFERVERTWRF
jgi:hypothetical protein